MTQGSFGLHRIEGEVSQAVGEEENNGVTEVRKFRDLIEEDQSYAGEEQQNEEEENEEREDIGDHARDSANERANQSVETEEENDLEPDAPNEKSQEIDFSLSHTVFNDCVEGIYV